MLVSSGILLKLILAVSCCSSWVAFGAGALAVMSSASDSLHVSTSSSSNRPARNRSTSARAPQPYAGRSSAAAMPFRLVESSGTGHTTSSGSTPAAHASQASQLSPANIPVPVEEMQLDDEASRRTAQLQQTKIGEGVRHPISMLIATSVKQIVCGHQTASVHLNILCTPALCLNDLCAIKQPKCYKH